MCMHELRVASHALAGNRGDGPFEDEKRKDQKEKKTGTLPTCIWVP